MGIFEKGVLGVVVGDALGCPVQFESRNEVKNHPITGMRGYGTFNLPEGSWTDDSSLTLALLDSLIMKNGVDLSHVMKNFSNWLLNGEFTPYGYAYDIGGATEASIITYIRTHDVNTCGRRGENSNGNGSLMRIMPICLYCYAKGMEDSVAINTIHAVSKLTHAHLRSQIACGLYYFMVKSILDNDTSLGDRLQKGIDAGFEFYRKNASELDYYKRLYRLYDFMNLPDKEIRSSGYVVDTLEAAVWCLVNEGSFTDTLLRAVNLGDDSDTVGAVCGGLAGLYYGIGGDKGIPYKWIDTLQKKNLVEVMCTEADNRLGR